MSEKQWYQTGAGLLSGLSWIFLGLIFVAILLGFTEGDWQTWTIAGVVFLIAGMSALVQNAKGRRDDR